MRRGWPGSSIAVLISTSLKATGMPSSRSRSSIIWLGESSCLTFAAGMRSAGSTSLIHAAGLAVEEQDTADAGHLAVCRELKRLGLVRRGPGRLHAEVVAVGLEPESFGDARVGVEPAELGDAAAQLDADRLRFGKGIRSGRCRCPGPDEQSPADQSPGCRGRPGSGTAGAYQQVLQNLLGLRVQGHPTQRDGSIAGSFRAGTAGGSRHTLMLGNRHAVKRMNSSP